MLSNSTNITNLIGPLYTLLKTQSVGVLAVYYKNSKNPIKIGHGKLEAVTIFMCCTLLSVDKATPFAYYVCMHKCFNLHYCNPLCEYNAPDFQLLHVNF